MVHRLIGSSLAPAKEQPCTATVIAFAAYSVGGVPVEVRIVRGVFNPIDSLFFGSLSYRKIVLRLDCAKVAEGGVKSVAGGGEVREMRCRHGSIYGDCRRVHWRRRESSILRVTRRRVRDLENLVRARANDQNLASGAGGLSLSATSPLYALFAPSPSWSADLPGAATTDGMAAVRNAPALPKLEKKRRRAEIA